MKKPLNRFLYKFFKGELEDAREKGILTQKQVQDILYNYTESEGFNYVWVLSSVGALLIGLGFLLVVANNWQALPDIGKLAILIASFTAALSAAHLTRDKTRYTSLALLYTSALIFGSGIFLTVNAYALNMEPSTQIYLWVLGVLALSAYRRDMILFIFAHVLVFIFITTGFDQLLFFHGVPLIGVLYLGNRFFEHKIINTYFSLAVSLVFVVYTLDYANLDTFYTAWIVFAIGLLMMHLRHNYNQKAFRVLGIITVGITGFALSFKDVWTEISFFGEGRVVSIVFSIGFAIYMLYLLTQRQVIPLIVVGALIIRYYFDTLYDFLPRALFFVIGGLLILAIGVFIERFYNKEA